MTDLEPSIKRTSFDLNGGRSEVGRPTHFKIGPDRPSQASLALLPPHHEGRDGPIIERAHSSCRFQQWLTILVAHFRWFHHYNHH